MVEKNLDFWLPGGGITYTPGGLAWLSPWGSLRYASTAAFLAFVWADDPTVGTPSKKETYRAFAEKQINYILGDNPRKGSYVVGFGENSPKHPHHRTARVSIATFSTAHWLVDRVPMTAGKMIFPIIPGMKWQPITMQVL